MKFCAISFASLAFAAALSAQNAPVHLLVSNGMKAVVEQLQPGCERAVGRPLAIEFGSTAGLKQKIAAGSAFDVLMVSSDAVADLEKENKIMPGTTAELARSGIGVGIKKGTPRPDIGTADAMKRTLREAQSITFAQDGASRAYLDAMFERLGVASELKPKIVMTQGSGPALERVASGKTGMVLTLTSELMPVHGIDIVGPLPGDLQHYVTFAAAVGSKAADAKTAKGVIACVKAASAAGAYKANGMEPR
jgi:molybdate transport system substrate-binding protein